MSQNNMESDSGSLFAETSWACNSNYPEVYPLLEGSTAGVIAPVLTCPSDYLVT